MKPAMLRMLSAKIAASALLILLGFGAGVGLNLLPVSTTVQGATGDPNPALKAVAHDATLAGDGTLSAPLGVANGGITAPKLSAAVPPSEGQLLGFNGANLAWQNAPIGGVRVVDSLGHLVGPFDLGGTYLVFRKIGNTAFTIRVKKDGFWDDGGAFYHTTTDCSGPRYFLEDGTALFRGTLNSRTQLFFAAEPLQQITVRSLDYFVSFDQPSVCYPLNPTIYSAGLLDTFDLTTLGLVPPFHLEF